MPRSQAPAAHLFTLLAIVVAVVALYFGREVLIPLALAILFSFLLEPLVRRLERLGVWRVLAVLMVAGLAFAVVIAIGYVLAGQIVELADRLPQYRDAIHERVASVRQSTGGIFSRATRNIQEIGRELATQPVSGASPAAAPASAPSAIPVRVVEGTRSPLDLALTALGSLVHPVLTAGLVILFVLFILVQREDLRDRIIRLAGQERLDVTTQAFDDAAQRISRYLLMQATINTAYGLIVALGLYLLGLPNAFLWGFLVAALRFIPYIGVWIGMLMPVALSLAVWPQGWGRPLAVIGLVVGLETLTANFVEPLVYGSGTGITPLAVLLAAVFWGTLWGPVGLLLSTPLTVCLAVIGKYVPMLGFLEVLLADEPALDPPVRFYQRLLADDKEDAMDLAETFLEDTSLVTVYDDVLIPALRLAKIDRRRGQLDESRAQAILDAVQETVDRLVVRDRELRPSARHQGPRPADASLDASANGIAAKSPGIQVLCLPATDQFDELIAIMLAQVMIRAGVRARSLPASMLVSEMLEAVEGSGARIACISALPPGVLDKARHLSKRLKVRFPSARSIVGLWAADDTARARGRLTAASADHVVTNISTVLQILQPMLIPAGA